MGLAGHRGRDLPGPSPTLASSLPLPGALGRPIPQHCAVRRPQLVHDGTAGAIRRSSRGDQVTELARALLTGVSGREVSLRLDCTGDRTSRIAFFADGVKVAEATDRRAFREGSVFTDASYFLLVG